MTLGEKNQEKIANSRIDNHRPPAYYKELFSDEGSPRWAGHAQARMKLEQSYGA